MNRVAQWSPVLSRKIYLGLVWWTCLHVLTAAVFWISFLYLSMGYVHIFPFCSKQLIHNWWSIIEVLKAHKAVLLWAPHFLLLRFSCKEVNRRVLATFFNSYDSQLIQWTQCKLMGRWLEDERSNKRARLSELNCNSGENINRISLQQTTG